MAMPAVLPEAWYPQHVRLYLENAYYKVEGSITLPGSYAGLGGTDTSQNDTTGKYAFRGVIVGSNNATITNNSANPLISMDDSLRSLRFQCCPSQLSVAEVHWGTLETTLKSIIRGKNK